VLRLPGHHIVEKMNRELGLTPAQRDQIDAIMADARFRMMDMRRQIKEQRHAIFRQSLMKIRAILTPEQQKKFDRDFVPPWIRNRGESGPPPQGGGPAPQPETQH
jgi:Spy/CpxP family protein refolding chaperone